MKKKPTCDKISPIAERFASTYESFQNDHELRRLLEFDNVDVGLFKYN